MTESYLSYPPTLSYWEISEYLKGIDLLVIGGGIVGLTTAIYYKRKNPKAKVSVIEKGTLPSGASTKNAGFACFGSLSELLADLEDNSIDDVFNLVDERISGLNALRELLSDKQLGYEACGGFELFTQNDAELFEKCVDLIPEANRQLQRMNKFDDTYSVVSERISQFGFEKTENLILNKHEGSIDTGKMMRGLTKKATDLEIDILYGLEVDNWKDAGNSVKVSLFNSVEFSCNRIHIATNGFANKLLPKEDVKPARAQVLITEPIKDLKVKGTFHLDAGFYYFRNVGNRLLLGGGRNLDLQGETSSELAITEIIQAKLDELLATVILPNQSVNMDHRWAGIMGVGKTKKPIIKQVSDRVTCSVRLGGMGVALGTSIGQQSANIIG